MAETETASTTTAVGDGCDLVLRNARVLDPSQGIDQITDVAIQDGRIAAFGASFQTSRCGREVDLSGKFVCPGLVDLHGHWYEGSAYGVDPHVCLLHGVTTAVDAGTTGFVNFSDFRRRTIETAEVGLLAFLNISALGIPASFAGELNDIRYARPRETAAIARRNADIVIGLKIRQGGMNAGPYQDEALDRALEAAELCALPVMVHISKGANTPGILGRLRPGDIVTHCFQGRGDGIVSDGRMLDEALRARERGVLFDVGHGAGSFRWDTARTALASCFLPDVISTDLHRYSVDRWAISMADVMSKFLHLGMALQDVVRRSTWAPAKAIGRDAEIGTLKPGTVADLFVFELQEGEFPQEDTHLAIEVSRCRVKPCLTIRKGCIVPRVRDVRLRPLLGCDYETLRYIEESA